MVDEEKNGYVKGIIYKNTAPEIRIENWEDFVKIKNTLKSERSPVIVKDSQTTISHGFIYQGVVYIHEKSKEK